MTVVAFVYVAFALAAWIGRGVVLYWRNAHDPKVTPGMFERCVEPAPSVTVVVPARNEEENLPACLDGLFAQDYPNFDVVVVDDRSADRTAEIVEGYARRDARLRLVRNRELPEGWSGRNHALELGAREARGEWLLFVDADTRHSTDNLSQAVTYAARNRVDMLTLGMPHRNVSFWQKTLKPGTMLVILIMHRLSKVNDPRAADVLATGQYVLIRRAAYDRVGGRGAMPSATMDRDLAWKVKSAGMKLVCAYGPGLCEARSYTSLRGIWRAETRILGGMFGRSPAAIAYIAAFLLLLDVLPYAAFAGALTAWLAGVAGMGALFALSAVMLATVQAVTAAAYRTLRSDARYAALHLVAGVVVLAMVLAGGFKVMARRGFAWKDGRTPAAPA